MARWISKLGIFIDTPIKALKDFAGAAITTARALRSIGHALDFTNVAATKSFQLNKTMTETAAQMGMGATALTDQVINLSNATGLSTEKTGALVQALAAAGQEINNIDPRLAELTGRFGMSTQGAAQLVAATRNLGTTITSLTDDVASWQVQFKMPGMLQQLPEVLEYSRKTLADFGSAVVGDTKTVLENTMKTGAVYARVFGVDMPQAIQMAQQSESKFASSLSNSRRVFLGLSKDFDALTMSLMETGQLGFQEIQDMLKEGQKDPVIFAKHIQEMEERMRAAGEAGKFMADRLHEQMLMNAPQAVKELLTSEGALAEAIKKRAEAQRIANTDVGKGTGAFDDMTASLKDTAGTAIETFKNLLGLGKTIIGLAFADDVNHMFKGLNETLKGLNVRIKVFAENITKSKAFQVLRPIIHAVGKALIIVGMAASAAATALAPLFTMMSGFGRIANLLPRASVAFDKLGEASVYAEAKLAKVFGGGGIITRAFTFLPRLVGKAIGSATGGIGRLGSLLLGGLAPIASKVAKFFLGPFQAIKAVFVALNDIGKAFADPDLTPAQKMVKIIRGVFVGLANFIDSMLLGIPSFIMKTFFPSMGRSLEGGVKKLFRKIERWIGGDGKGVIATAWNKIHNFFVGALNKLTSWISVNFKKWLKTVHNWGRNIGRAMGGMAKMVVDFVKRMFSVKFWKDAWDTIVSWFSSDGKDDFTGSIGDIFVSALILLSDFGTSLLEGMMEAFGTSTTEVGELWDGWMDSLKDGWDHLWTGLGQIMQMAVDGWVGIFKGIGIMWSSFLLGLKKGWNFIWGGIESITAKIVGGLSTNIIAPFLEFVGGKILEVIKIANKLGLVSDDTLKSAQSLYDSSTGTVKNLSAVLQEQVAANAKAREKDVANDEAAINQKVDNLNTYMAASDAAMKKEDEDLAKRDLERMKKSEARQARVYAKIKSEKEQRAKEEEGIRSAKAALAQAKQAGAAQLGGAIKQLSDALETAKKSNDKYAIDKAQRRLDKVQDYLDKVQDASKPETIKKVMERAAKYLGKIGVSSEEKATPALPGAGGTSMLMPDKGNAAPPTAAAMGAGTMKQPQPTPPPPAPGQQSVTVRNVLELKGDLGKMVEKTQAEAMASTGGGIGGTQ